MNNRVLSALLLTAVLCAGQCWSLPQFEHNPVGAGYNVDINKYVVRLKRGVNFTEHKDWVNWKLVNYTGYNKLSKRDSSQTVSLGPSVQIGSPLTDSHASTYYSANLTPELAARIESSPEVAYVEPDVTLTSDATSAPLRFQKNFGISGKDSVNSEEEQELRTQLAPYGDQSGESTNDYMNVNFRKVGLQEVAEEYPTNWGLDRIDQRSDKPDYMYEFEVLANPAEVYVYVVDSGVMTDHVEFQGRASMAFCNENFFGANNCLDNMGHGSHAAGIIAGYTVGVAKQVKVIGVKIMDRGNTSSSATISALNFISEHARQNPGPKKVVNLSFGGQRSDSLNKIVEHLAVDRDCVVVVAAGNNMVDACNISPASSEHVLTVGSVDSANRISSTSNYGKCVNIYAPGRRIKSVGTSSTTSYKIMSGTSMAAPHVAGVAAFYRSKYPTASQEQVRKAILSSATKHAIGLGKTSNTQPTLVDFLSPWKWKSLFSKSDSVPLLYSRL